MEAFFLAFLFVCLGFFWAHIILGSNVCFYQWSFHSNQSFFQNTPQKSRQLLPITHFQSCFYICRYLIPKSVLVSSCCCNKHETEHKQQKSVISEFWKLASPRSGCRHGWILMWATYWLSDGHFLPVSCPGLSSVCTRGKRERRAGGSQGRDEVWEWKHSLESFLTGTLILLHLVPSLMTLFNLISSWVPCLQI